MRTTIRDLCISALRIAKVVDANETPEQDDISNALDYLNTWFEQMTMEGYFNPIQKTIQVTPSQSQVRFNPNVAEHLPSYVYVDDSVASITRIIDMVLQVELIAMPYEDFQIQQIGGGQHTYYTLIDLTATEQGLFVAPQNNQLAISYYPMATDRSLDDVFGQIYPQSNWGVAEYGLATILCSVYGSDPGQVSAIYQSRLDRLTSYNYKPSILNHSRNVGTFDSGWF